MRELPDVREDRLLPGLQLFEQRQARLQFGLQQAARLRGQRDDVIADALPELRRGWRSRR
ncbi:hypothetical protein [Burkholderia glumae]|uniref:hypothetical protein n=1 Tax=Burkholderia glumae TaxID=337 RepID=UPI0020D11440|nr:hypothetical protein [Burkholderia glumae]